jgi:hypothetical protein
MSLRCESGIVQLGPKIWPPPQVSVKTIKTINTLVYQTNQIMYQNVTGLLFRKLKIQINK